MGLWNNIKNLFKAQQSAVQVPNSSWTGPGYDFSDWAKLADDKNSALETNEEIFSVISRLSNIVSSLPIHYYKKYETNDNDSTAQLLRMQPNSNMTGFDLINRTEVARNTAGNAFIWIERDPSTAQVSQLWPIDPRCVTVMRNTDDNSIWYQVDDNEGHHFLVFNTDMIHVKHINPLDGELGISPIDVLRGSLKFQKEIQEYSITEMAKKEAYIITYDRSVSKESRQAILNDFRQMVRSNGGAILVEQGYNVNRYDSKFKPGDLQAVEAISRTRIANAFNVPLSFLNDGQAKSSTSVENVMTDFAITALVPIIRQYEAEFNRKLLTPQARARGYNFKFNINGLMRGDTAARTQFYQMMIRNGIATQNELRKLEDLPPIKEESANVLWISKDLFPSENQLKASNVEANSTDKNPADTTKKGGDQSNEGKEPDNSKIPDNQATGRKQRSNHVY